MTAEGKKFDLEITYQSDGSYTFRTNRGTPRSASGTRISGGVLKGKSYTTGDPVTIALYEDEKGNRVLKGQRTDGLTWTIAKTKYALSSFLAAGGSKVKVTPVALPSGTTPKPVPGAASPTTIAKAGPPGTPLPDAATTTWTQTPIKNIRSIAGQWSGTGTTAKGGAYSVTYVFKRDGALSFSFHGVMGRKSGSRSAGALSVSNGTMQYTHAYHLWTITLHQDATGKKQLRGHRDDGYSWQLNRR